MMQLVVFSQRCFVFGMFLVNFLASEAVFGEVTLKIPTDLSRVSLYLHTVDVGEPLYSKFGHTAVRVRDEDSGYDQVFNLGTFDDSDPMFAVNFYTGVMYYRMTDYPYRVAIRGYQYEKRKVWEDKFNFNNDEKRRLLERLSWQSQPENRSYAYQYFFDNCSTRIRDFVDDAIGGALKQRLGDQLSQDTFRGMVRSHMATFSFGSMSLDILMNSRLDRRMTLWEEMFLPMRLRLHILNQKTKANESRLIETKILVDGTPPTPMPMTAYACFSFVIGLPIIVWLLTTTKSMPSVAGVRSQSISLILWGGFSGVFGLVMLLNWLLSCHLDLHHNACLIILFPTDIWLVWLGCHIKQSLHANRLKLLRMYCVTRMGMLLGAFILHYLGFIQQDIAPVYFTFGALGMLLFALFAGPAGRPAAAPARTVN